MLELGEQSGRFVYEFNVWPSAGWEPAVYEIFKSVHRQAMEFTVDGFADFRSSLERCGFSLREVTRVPYHDPEILIL